jgi:hypothetical protein
MILLIPWGWDYPNVQFEFENSLDIDWNFLIEAVFLQKTKRDITDLLIGTIRNANRSAQLGFPDQFGQLLQLFICDPLSPNCPENKRKLLDQLGIAHNLKGNFSLARGGTIEKLHPISRTGFQAERFCIYFKFVAGTRRYEESSFHFADIPGIETVLEAETS